MQKITIYQQFVKNFTDKILLFCKKKNRKFNKNKSAKVINKLNLNPDSIKYFFCKKSNFDANEKVK